MRQAPALTTYRPRVVSCSPWGLPQRHRCREIQKLVEHLSKRRDQASKGDSSPPWRSGKEKVPDANATVAERELGYQTPKKDLKGLFHQSDSESGGTSAARSCMSCVAAAQSSFPG
jgi:hypothetical protein